MFPIPALLSMFTGCTETEKPNPDPAQFTLQECFNADYSYEISNPVSVTKEELTPLLDEQGQITEEACQTICTNMDIDYTCVCSYVGKDGEDYNFDCITQGVDYNEPVEGRGNADISMKSTGIGLTPIAKWSARAYHAEASSVAAFLQIRKELEGFGAPKALVDRCLKAACDEVAHAKAMSHICITNGGQLSQLSFGELPQRSLFEFAMDNIKEGCVGEAYAATCVMYQSQVLQASSLQKLLRSIAQDEMRHVELAYDIFTWCCTQLTPIEQQVLLTKQRALFDALIEHRTDNARTYLPLPPQNIIKAMADALCAHARKSTILGS